MARKNISADRIDKAVATFISRDTDRPVERIAQLISYLGDEHVILPAVAAIAAGAMLTDSRRKVEWERLVVILVVTVALDHLSKHVFAQVRPDRQHPGFRLRDRIKRAGTGDDAFPSGHAMHLGALASSLSAMYPQARGLIWTAALAVASAHAGSRLPQDGVCGAAW